MRELADIIRCFEARKEEEFAMATLVGVQGSAYRRAGARMLIDRDALIVGGVSAGCVEEEIAERARMVLVSDEPAWMTFDTRRRFGCQGSLDVFIERLRPAFLPAVGSRWRQRLTTTIATVFARDALNPGSRIAEESTAFPDETLFQQIAPALRLVAIGAGPEDVALGQFARTLGWEFELIEDLGDRPALFDAWTAVVVKTHHYGRDFAAVRTLSELGLPYIGLMGSRQRREQLVADLIDSGATPSAAFRSPAGLDLEADSPESVALSIVAEIQAVVGAGSGTFLTEKRGPVHRRDSKPVLIR